MGGPGDTYMSGDGAPSSAGDHATSAGASKVKRADFSSMKTMEENHQRATAVRQEHVVRQEQLQEQRERFRQRGAMLRAQRLQEKDKQAIEDHHNRNSRLGELSRAHQARLRVQREGQQQRWEEHGRQLTEQHQQLRARLRKAQEDERVTRTESATSLKKSLKKLNELTDDSILLVNTERATRVKAETGSQVTTHAKLMFLNERWNAADALREQMEALRRRQRQQEQQYLDTAHMIKASSKRASDEAYRLRKEEQMREALELRAWEKRMAAEMKAAKESEVERKRHLHETMEADKIVPEQELQKALEAVQANATASTLSLDPLEESSTGGGDGPAAMFARFFGFRKRGSNQHLTSVAF